MQLEPLEPQAEWRHEDVADPSRWIERLTAAETDELDAALRHARAKSGDLLDIGKEDFPLPTLGARLRRTERELIDGRGFVLLRGIPRERYDNDEMCFLYWGIGMHLGKPWPQNKRGHVLGDVTDQGKKYRSATSSDSGWRRRRFPAVRRSSKTTSAGTGDGSESPAASTRLVRTESRRENLNARRQVQAGGAPPPPRVSQQLRKECCLA